MLSTPRRHRRLSLSTAVVAAGVLLLAVFTGEAGATPKVVTPPAIPGVAGLPGPLAAPATPADRLGILKATPDTGPPGTPFVLTGSGLPANTDIDITWSTATKAYKLDVVPDSVDFYGRVFNPTAVVLTKGRTDASGNLRIATKMPRDYGALHDIYAVAGGKQLAKGGVLVQRTYSVKPLRGPVGQTISIKLTGLGWLAYMDTVAVIWDNKYTGFLSSVTTRGEAVATIRAAGPPGKHVLELVPASATTPFLNITQSAVGYLGYKRYTFTVTKDAGPPPTKIVNPVDVAPTSDEKTAFRSATVAGVTAKLSETSGIINTKTTLTATGLTPGPATIQWNTAIGTRTGAGYANVYKPLQTVTVPANGSLKAEITVPDDVGGWHWIEILQGTKTKASVSFRIDQSLYQGGINKTTFKQGEIVRIHLKGVGFTEMDNILAVNVDNAYIGYVCGFFSAGDTVLEFVATGAPGTTHIVDMYPTIYKQQKGGNDIWYGATPFLTFRTDYPLLALGYKLPSYHFAYKIVK